MPGSEPERSESGAVLVLALLFMGALALITIALASLAANDLLGAHQLKTVRATNYAAEGATEAAVQAVRYNYLTYTTTATCTPGGSASVSSGGISIQVYCSGPAAAVSNATRVVTFYACPAGQAMASCTASPILKAQATFDDYTLSHTIACSAAQGTTTCGQGMSIDTWSLRNA